MRSIYAYKLTVHHTLRNVGQGWILDWLSIEFTILRGMKKRGVVCELFSLLYIEGLSMCPPYIEGFKTSMYMQAVRIH